MAGIEFGEDNDENRKRLETWFDARAIFIPDKKIKISFISALSNRAAFRTIPVILTAFRNFAEKDWSAPLMLHSLHCLLMSSFDSWSLSENGNNNSFSISAAKSAAKIASRFAGTSAQSALFAAASTDPTTFHAFSYSSKAIWESVIRDMLFWEKDINASSTLLTKPLFINEGFANIGWTRKIYSELDALGRDYPEYEFWVRWIKSVYDGRGMYGQTRSDREWGMLKEIALIDDAIWKQGAKAVGEEIARIEGAYLEEMLPIAEVISLNPSTKKAVAVPIKMSPDQRYQNVLIKITRQISKFEGDGLHNQFSAMGPVIKDLTEVIDQFSDNPGMVHDELSSAKRSIAYLLEQKELPEDVRLERLQTDIAVGCIDIQEAVPEVAATVEARIPKLWAEADDETRMQILRLNEEMPQATEGALTIYQAQDLQMGMDGDPRGLRRWFARSIRIYSVAKDYLAHPLFWQKVYELISQLF